MTVHLQIHGAIKSHPIAKAKLGFAVAAHVQVQATLHPGKGTVGFQDKFDVSKVFKPRESGHQTAFGFVIVQIRGHVLTCHIIGNSQVKRIIPVVEIR